jgi:hypothetical protein
VNSRGALNVTFPSTQKVLRRNASFLPIASQLQLVGIRIQ